jgi:dienelactone hydrolase
VFTGRPRRVAAAALAAGAAMAVGFGATAEARAPAAAAPATGAVVREYHLGQIALPTHSRFGPIPVALRGVIGAPRTGGPHPIVLVLHGRHDPGCPAGKYDSETWPCFDTEHRYDLGLAHVVRALAERGIVAIAPSLGAAFTAGWGDPDDLRRWPAIVNRVLEAVAREDADGSGRFGVALQGRIDLSRLGLLGHSLSGEHALRMARRRRDAGSPEQIARGRGPVRALFLLTPTPEGGRPPDVTTRIVVAGCDGDTGDLGSIYFRLARRSPRRSPITLVRLPRANHNFFNRTLARLRADDAPREQRACRPRNRPSAGAQQRWLDRAAVRFFRSTLGPRSAQHPVRGQGVSSTV